eukprot:CAMPEP_0194215254 /NCGR_PEP_ID=MMETSP0156-20130528/16923_1 /TAXON_ID=33649 /ORGANISM="Thalassionema nitzschioides, Strain L26-B" /LENGTH=494 /DNA_ID=CAMNT_0038943723 /DNA_START=27 /DNA_END=1507 /DNA_ORIENTATION=+
MPTSIPYDSTLVLGNIIDPTKIEELQELEEAEESRNLLSDHLNNLILSNRNFTTIYNEMVNMGVEDEDLEKLQDEQKKLKKEMSKTAVDLGNETIATQQKMRAIKLKQRKKKIGKIPTSPIDFTQSEIKTLPLSSDSMSMDVQYFRNEGSETGAASHAATVSAHIASSFADTANPKTSSGMARSARQAVEKQHENHELEGTIVVTANCTHKQAVMFEPFIINPYKSVASWNTMFPKDKVELDPATIYRAAMADYDEKDANVMHIMSGCTRGSSFVGMVHLLRVEKTDSQQSADSLAKQMKDMMTKYLGVSEQSGQYGIAEEFAKEAKNLISSSQLSNHCTLVTEGVIPNIASNTMKTTVANLKPNPQEVMSQLAAIQAASDGVVNETLEQMAAKAKTGAQFMKLNSDYISKTTSALGAYDNENNQVIDMNSLMTAFTDYVQKAQSGESGIPLTFNIRDIYKKDVAAAYIAKYYPNGAVNQKDALRGQVRSTPTT